MSFKLVRAKMKKSMHVGVLAASLCLALAGPQIYAHTDTNAIWSDESVSGDESVSRTLLGRCPSVSYVSQQQHVGPSTLDRASPTQVVFSSIAEVREQLICATLNVSALTQYFLKRIAIYDQSGPRINAIIELNPDSLRVARNLDLRSKDDIAERPLYGIPILLKDNIDTADHMQTSAGSLALVGLPAEQDAPLVTKLRAAGALILGKANMSEWANFRSTNSTHGWSARGGLTRNPHVLDRSPCGSSSGSAAAVAAGFATAAIGTETDMSIVCPSAANGVVGLKPTLGLVSRSGIVPISRNQDTAGPITRTVADAASILTVIAGSDPEDPATKDADKHATDYTRFLDAGALKGKRIGVVHGLARRGRTDPSLERVMDHTLAILRAQGATVVDPVTIPHVYDFGDAEMTSLLYDFKQDLNSYLATRRGTKIGNLSDLIAYNDAHAVKEMPWFGQDILVAAQAKTALDEPAYRKALATAKQLSGPQGIDAALSEHNLDALLTPTTSPAWSLDLVNGDRITGSSSSPAAVSGYPSITVPAGFIHCLPVGVSFFSGKWREPTLIGIAYAFEQAARVHREPEFLSSVADCKQMDVPGAGRAAVTK